MSETYIEPSQDALNRIESDRRIRSYERLDRRHMLALTNLVSAVDNIEDALEISLHAANAIWHLANNNANNDVAYALQCAREAIDELTRACVTTLTIAVTTTEVARQTLSVRDREMNA